MNPENLSPIQPGEVRNPKGINQYSYRQDFEKTVDALLASKVEYSREPIDLDEGKKVACIVCGLRKCDVFLGGFRYGHESCIQGLEGKTRGEVIGEITVRLAMCGDEKMLPDVLKRLWPAVNVHEVADTTADFAGLAASLARFAPKPGAGTPPGGNGSKRTNGSGGMGS